MADSQIKAAGNTGSERMQAHANVISSLAAGTTAAAATAFNADMINRQLHPDEYKCAQYIAPNQSTYDKGQSQIKTGVTPNQLVTNNFKNNPVSTGIAGVGMMGAGAAAGGATALGTRVLAVPLKQRDLPYLP